MSLSEKWRELRTEHLLKYNREPSSAEQGTKCLLSSLMKGHGILIASGFNYIFDYANITLLVGFRQ